MNELLLDPAEPVRFSPRENPGVVFLLRVPRVADRARYQRAVRAEGGQTWTALHLAHSLRAGVDAILADEPSLHATFAAKVEAYRGGILEAVETYRVEPTGENFLPVLQASVPDDSVQEIMDIVVRHYPPFADRLADNEVYPAVAGLVACRMFLVGWEGRPVAFRRVAGAVPDDLLGGISDSEIVQIGAKVASMLHPGEERAKNSA